MSEADAPDVYRLNSDPEVVRYVGEPVLTGTEQALEVLRSIILPQYRHGVGRWAVVSKETGLFAGWCGLRYYPEKDEYDLGFRFLREHWGKGYATESAKAVLEFARERLPGRRIVGKALLENTGSIKVLEKIGMRLEGHGWDHDGRIAIYVLSQTDGL